MKFSYENFIWKMLIYSFIFHMKNYPEFMWQTWNFPIAISESLALKISLDIYQGYIMISSQWGKAYKIDRYWQVYFLMPQNVLVSLSSVYLTISFRRASQIITPTLFRFLLLDIIIHIPWLVLTKSIVHLINITRYSLMF